jgi:(R,R)-butanediol dehydrogenase/meso-butanediol dehydrogenase/diacetyl reductase
MRAAVYHGNHQLKIVEVPEPAAWAGQVKVRVSRNGICGTDLHEYFAGPIFIPLSEPHPLTGKKIPLVFRARILRHRHGSRRRGDRRARG